MRSMIELGMFQYKKKIKKERLSTTDACASFANDVMKTELISAWLEVLEPGRDPSSVKKELKDLYHELSKPAHSDMEIEGAEGLYVAGDFPLRAAVGVTILALQRERCMVDMPPVMYARKGHDAVISLREGEPLLLEKRVD